MLCTVRQLCARIYKCACASDTPLVWLVSDGGLCSSGAGAENRNHVHMNQASSFTKTVAHSDGPHYSYTTSNILTGAMPTTQISQP